MGDPVFIMRGPFQIQVIEQDVLKAALGVTFEELQTIGSVLDQAPGFLDSKRVYAIVADTISDVSASTRLSQLILRLQERLSLTEGSIDEFLLELDKKNSKTPDLSLDEIVELKRRLPLIATRFQGFKLQSKADRLARALGQPLESARLVCDLRPVFNDDKSQVVGMMPITTLKISLTAANGLPISTEVTMTRNQVSELLKHCVEAETKLRSLFQLLEQQKTVVPVTAMTQ